MSAANLFAGILFGCVGFGAFIYGKKQSSFKTMTIAAALIIFPYFVSNTIALYAIGVVLTTLLFIWHD